ncbi:hypothetical protein [Streptomyces albireticuli]|uniref:hypothetical protein n=1 Tax=Streptomyces albireticuli TaxID=1940 RepID=UPI0013311977|nr:hypothetical protein [Streptomyces albireticuli]
MGALVVGASLTTTGCANYFGCGVEGKRPAGLTREDLIGAYAADPFGRVELKADGTFTASDWPEFNYPDDPRRAGGGAGTWRLEPAGDTAIVGDDVELSFEGKAFNGAGWKAKPEAFRQTYSGFGFDVAGTREGPRMYRYAEDPDICELHVLRRAKSE